jgi:4-amino-4-deoxy-L-arabinose transferase-like glycosyltransferase
MWLLVILAVGTLLRIWVWRQHAIDPDEGAQLMDGRLALRGLVPFVDFQSRQIFYTYLMAGLIRLLGPDYSRVRLAVVFTDALTATLIFVIGRRLFDARVGLLAAAAYLLFPLAAGSAPIVHTESFAVFAACTSAYCLVRHIQAGGGWGALLAAGTLIAAGIYVRESGLAIGLGAILTLTLLTWQMPGLLLRRYAVLAAGFLIPCAGVGLWYSRFLSPAQWWWSHLNPFYVLLRHSRSMATLAATASQAVPAEPSVGGPLHPQPWWATWHVLGEVSMVYGALLAALALSIVMVVASIKKRRESARFRLAGALLYPWALSLALAYGYWAVYRGFFPEYAIELLPPLVMIFGFVVFELGRGWQLGPLPGWGVLVLVAGAVTVLIASHLGMIQVPRFMYLAIVPLILGRPWLTRKGSGQWWPIAAVVGVLALVLPLGLPASVHRALKLMAVAGLILGGWAAARRQHAPGQSRLSLLAYIGLVLLGTGAGVLDAMGQPKQLRPGGAWLPSAVQQIADTLRRRGQETDEVISGGIIWEFQASRQPFERITHPLRFEFGIAPDEAAALTERLRERPPKFIVFDGYTERTYGAVLPALAQIVGDRYELVVTVPGGRYPVRLYELRQAEASP